MECKGKLKGVSKDWLSGKWQLTFETSEDITSSLASLQDCDLNITAKKYRNKRSRDSNAYAWVLMQKIAEVIHSDKWSVYLLMLQRYSSAFTHIIVKPNMVERVKEEWRTVIELGTVNVNGQEGVQLQCYFGSSTFDSKEMSVFIDGIVSECKELGIETLPPDEIERMNKVWDMAKGKKLWSIFTDDMDTCIFTGSTTVERHHVFGGTNRARSEGYGFVVPLRPDLHPNGVHFVATDENKKIDRYLKETCQKYYESHYGTREQFIKEFGKSYL